MIDHNFMKRMAPLLVLEILKVHTDEEHGLKVTQIVELLEQDYHVVLERKAVSRILNDLLELSEIPENYDWKNPMRFSIKYETTKRKTGDIRDGWRLCREFEDAELRMIMDAVLSVRSFSSGRLISKLQRLGSRSLADHSRYVQAFRGGKISTPLLMPNVYDIYRAINSGRKIIFSYGDYDVDKKLHLQQDDDGKDRLYEVSPYQLAFRNGIYYLIGFDEQIGAITSYRVDRIRRVMPTGELSKDYRTIEGTTGRKLDLRQYLDQHIYMCDGQTVTASFVIPETMIGDVLDLFGENISLNKSGDDCITVRAEVNYAAMIRFAKTFAPEVRVLAPVTLVKDVKQALGQALEVYEYEEDHNGDG